MISAIQEVGKGTVLPNIAARFTVFAVTEAALKFLESQGRQLTSKFS